jgi:hypothetical protein
MAVHILGQKFYYCGVCKKCVCADCFYIEDENRNAIAICSSCAKKRGLFGFTMAVVKAIEIGDEEDKEDQENEEHEE